MGTVAVVGAVYLTAKVASDPVATRYVAGAEHGKGLIGHLAARYHLEGVVAAQRAQASGLRAGTRRAHAVTGKRCDGTRGCADDHPHSGSLLLLEGPGDCA